MIGTVIGTLNDERLLKEIVAAFDLEGEDVLTAADEEDDEDDQPRLPVKEALRNILFGKIGDEEPNPAYSDAVATPWSPLTLAPIWRRSRLADDYGGACHYQGAGERAGTYTVRAEAAGFSASEASDLRVSEDGCHAEPVKTTLRLLPTGQRESGVGQTRISWRVLCGMGRPSNARQLPRGGWSRLGASSSARSS